MPNMVGCVNKYGCSIAFLYQLMPKCGTDGGLIEKCPLMDRCGSAKCGNDHEKWKNDLIRCIAFPTASRAASTGLVIADLILFQTDEAVE